MVFIIGAGGMLGQCVVRLLNASGIPFICSRKEDVDITNEIAIARLFKQVNVDIVVNCAAMTNVDKCEEDPEQAMLVNGEAVKFIARASKKAGALFYHISTDYVFDGKKDGTYNEDDYPNPLQVYGRSKLLGEKHALSEGGIVVRAQWLYGINKPNFVKWLIDSIKERKKINVSTTQVGTPTSAFWFAAVLMGAVSRLKKGNIYHLIPNGHVTRYDFAKYIVSGLGADVNDFIVPTDEKFGKAERPLNICLNNAKFFKEMGVETITSWKEDIDSFMRREYLIGLNDACRNVEDGMHKNSSAIFCG